EHLDAFAQPIDEFGGRIDSDIGEDQGVLDLLPRRFVEVVTRQEVEQSPPEAGVRLREPLTQAHQPAGRLRGHFGAASLGLLLLDRLGDLIDAELTGDIGIDAVLVAQALLLRVDAQADAQRNDEDEYDGRDDEQGDRLVRCSSVLLCAPAGWPVALEFPDSAGLVSSCRFARRNQSARSPLGWVPNVRGPDRLRSGTATAEEQSGGGPPAGAGLRDLPMACA